MKGFFGIAAIGFFLAACQTHDQSLSLHPAVHADPAEWNGVSTIAVLPADNLTMGLNLEYVAWYRAVIMSLLQQRGWTPVPIARVNRALNRWRFTMAGEVSQFTPEEVSAALECDAILSWAIVGFSPGMNRVVLNFSLHRRDGVVLWASGERVFDSDLNPADPPMLHNRDHVMSLALGETLRDFPVRQ